VNFKVAIIEMHLQNAGNWLQVP